MKISEELIKETIENHRLQKWSNRLTDEEFSVLVESVDKHLNQLIANNMDTIEDLIVTSLLTAKPKPEVKFSKSLKDLETIDIDVDMIFRELFS